MSAEGSPVNSDVEDEDTLMPADGNVIGSDDDAEQADYQDDAAALEGGEDEDEDDAVPMEPEEEAPMPQTDSGLRILSRGKRLKVWQSNVVRNHQRPVVVDSGEALAAMRHSGTKSSWPKVEPADIVVLKGDIADPDAENSLVSAYIWYVRAIVKDSSPEMAAMDASTLIHIPKAVTTSLVQAMSKEQRLSSSTLLKVYMPFNDNAKPFQPVGSNDWEVDHATFTSAEVREPKKRKQAAVSTAASGDAAAAAPSVAGTAKATNGGIKEAKKSKIDTTPVAPKKTPAAKKVNKAAEAAPASKAAAKSTPAAPPSAAPKVHPVFAAASKQSEAASPAPAKPVQQPDPLALPDGAAVDSVGTTSEAATPAASTSTKKSSTVRHVFPPPFAGQTEYTVTWTGTRVPGVDSEHEQCFVIPASVGKWSISVTLHESE